MTLVDFWKMIQRYWIAVVIIPLVCVATASFLLVATHDERPRDQAAIAIYPNSQLNSLTGLAINEAANFESDNQGIKISVVPESARMTVTITAVGDSLALCEEAVGQVAYNAVDKMRELYAGTISSENILTFEAFIGETKVEEVVASSTFRPKNIVLELAAGLLLSSIVIIVLYARRKPILSSAKVEDLLGIPVLDIVTKKSNGEELITNLRLVARQAQGKNLCLLPLSSSEEIKGVVDLVVSAAKRNDIEVSICEWGSADFASCAGNDATLTLITCDRMEEDCKMIDVILRADVVILVIEEMNDTLKELDSIWRELRLADANVAGVVYLGRR